MENDEHIILNSSAIIEMTNNYFRKKQKSAYAYFRLHKEMLNDKFCLAAYLAARQGEIMRQYTLHADNLFSIAEIAEDIDFIYDLEVSHRSDEIEKHRDAAMEYVDYIKKSYNKLI